jgi:hypothetical protein
MAGCMPGRGRSRVTWKLKQTRVGRIQKQMGKNKTGSSWVLVLVPPSAPDDLGLGPFSSSASVSCSVRRDSWQRTYTRFYETARVMMTFLTSGQ